MPRYRCTECGNTETFTSLGTIDAVAMIDGDGAFLSWVEKEEHPTVGQFEEPYACEECGCEDIHDEWINND